MKVQEVNRKIEKATTKHPSKPTTLTRYITRQQSHHYSYFTFTMEEIHCAMDEAANSFQDVNIEQHMRWMGRNDEHYAKLPI